jgi:hypothetical protein
MVVGSHKEVARLGRMVGSLLRDIISPRPIRIVPITSKGFSENGVQGLLDASVSMDGEIISMSSTAGSREEEKEQQKRLGRKRRTEA